MLTGSVDGYDQKYWLGHPPTGKEIGLDLLLPYKSRKSAVDVHNRYEAAVQWPERF